jgi:hypothetical protein
MEFPFANPPWNLLWLKRPSCWNANAVPKTTPFPFKDDCPEVLSEGFFVARPHQDRWMVLPPGCSPSQDIQNLHRFHSLFAQTFVVQIGSGFRKISVRKKSLHAVSGLFFHARHALFFV